MEKAPLSRGEFPKTLHYALNHEHRIPLLRGVARRAGVCLPAAIIELFWNFAYEQKTHWNYIKKRSN
jgi:hypothetical protein